MTAKLTPQARLLALVGLAGLLALAALMALRTGIVGSSTDASSSVTIPPKTTPATTPATPSSRPSRPKIELLAGLPAPVASKLRYSRVVVVALYTGSAQGDREVVGQARAGARQVGAGFTAVNLLDEKKARALQSFAGTVASPSTLVVRRPGKIVTRLEGFVDSGVVAQAAHNAGARR
jgi:hypothetical protein